MKKSILFFAGLFLMGAVEAQYMPTDQGSEVKFKVSNFGIGVDGSFKGLQGSIDFDPANAAAAHIDVSVDATTVNTDNSLRDSHLRNDGYFDVKEYPRIKLVSTKIVSVGSGGQYQFTGQLTIRNVTKEISFPFTVTESGGVLSFKGSFTIKRKDYNVGGTSTISNELTVSLTVQATKG